MKQRLIFPCMLAVTLTSLLLAGCNKSDVKESAADKTSIVAAQFSDVAKDPKDANDMFVSARYLAANSTLMAMNGELSKFNGTVLDSATKKVLEESSNIQENKLWPVVKDLAGYGASPGIVISTPFGKFVFFDAVHTESGQTYLVGINLSTKNASILEAIGAGYSVSTSSVLDAAALWAYRALGTIASYENKKGQVQSEVITKEYQSLAVGYLYAVENIMTEAERRRRATEQPSNTAQLPRIKSQELVFSGDTLSYPKGASEEALIAAVPAMQCMDFLGSRMCTAEVNLTQKVLLGGLPGSCMGGKEVLAELEENTLRKIACDVAPLVAEAVYNNHRDKFGDPKTKTVMISGMKTIHSEWQVGADYVMVTRYSGVDFYGKPINNFNVSISAKDVLNNSVSRVLRD